MVSSPLCRAGILALKRVGPLFVLGLALGGCKQGDATSDPAASAFDASAPAPSALPPVAVADPSVRPAVPPPPGFATVPEGAPMTPTGLATEVLVAGTGTVHPTPFDLVSYRYIGWTVDGRMLDTSIVDPKGRAYLGRVRETAIPGLIEGMTFMVAGEKRRMWIPAALTTTAPRGSGAPPLDLVMDVQLIEIMPTPKPPPFPEDGAAPRANARRIPPGASYRVVSSSRKAGAPPELDSVVVFNQTVWTRAGVLLASSFPAGRPEAVVLSELPPPWTAALKQSRVGDTVRIWYERDAEGPCVADIELVYAYSMHDPAPGAKKRGGGR